MTLQGKKTLIFKYANWDKYKNILKTATVYRSFDVLLEVLEVIERYLLDKEDFGTSSTTMTSSKISPPSTQQLSNNCHVRP